MCSFFLVCIAPCNTILATTYLSFMYIVTLIRVKRLHKVNRERSLAKPVIRARLSDSEESDFESHELRGENLHCYQGNSAEVVRRTYVLGSTLPFKRDATHEFKLLEGQQLKAQLRRSICSLINTGVECVIYLGVTSEGVVQGIQLDRDMMDSFCIRLDLLMSEFSPSIKHDRYMVNFVSVIGKAEGALKSAPKQREKYVIELTLLPSIVRQFYTFIKHIGDVPFERCYYRSDCSDIKLSFHSLRQRVAQEEMERCQQEVKALEECIRHGAGTSDTH